MNTKLLDNILLALIIIGSINWGLIGFFRFDLIAFLFGNMSWLTRIIYALVGIGGLYMILSLIHISVFLLMKTERPICPSKMYRGNYY